MVQDKLMLYQKIKKIRLKSIIWLCIPLIFFLYVKNSHASDNFDDYTSAVAIENQSYEWTNYGGGSCPVLNEDYASSSPNSLNCDFNYNAGGTVYNPADSSDLDIVFMNWRFESTNRKFTVNFWNDDGSYTYTEDVGYVDITNTTANLHLNAGTSVQINTGINDNNWHTLIIQASTTNNYYSACIDLDCSNWINLSNTFDSIVFNSDRFNPEIDFFVDDIIINNTTYDWNTYSLQWFFPQDLDENGNEYIISNSEWNDWGFYYNLSSDDIGTYNIIVVEAQSENGITYSDKDIITGTTSIVYWTINRSDNLENGLITANAQLWKTDSNSDCINDDSCLWEVVGYADEIDFYASSSGFTIFDVPGVSGFASSSISTTTRDFGLFINTVKNIFPINIVIQFLNMVDNIKNNTANVQPIDLKLKNLLSDDMKPYVSSTTSILKYEYIEDNLTVWDTKILPLMESLVYILNILFIIFVFFIPKTKDK